jgi:hypothetical protein
MNYSCGGGFLSQMSQYYHETHIPTETNCRCALKSWRWIDDKASCQIRKSIAISHRMKIHIVVYDLIHEKNLKARVSKTKIECR